MNADDQRQQENAGKHQGLLEDKSPEKAQRGSQDIRDEKKGDQRCPGDVHTGL